VSVIVPCHNYGRFLQACVESALDQEGVAVEVIIVDNASSDDTPMIAKQLAADRRVKILTRDVDDGHVTTFNDGLAAVTGDYIAMLSADDLLTRGALARSTAALGTHPQVGLVYGFARMFGEQRPERHTRSWYRYWSIWSGSQWLERVCQRGRNVMYSPEAVMRTSVVQEIGGYEPQLPHTCDMFMWLNVAAAADVAYVNGPTQALYRRHGSNMSTLRFGNRLSDLTERHRTFELFFARQGARFPDRDHMLGSVRAALSREALATACRWYDAKPKAGEDPAALAAFAVATSPDIRETPLWRAYERGTVRWQERQPRQPAQVGRAAVEALRAGSRHRLRRFIHFGA
jgi:glycosyltransferase involved in cell wall biosynthesis